MKREISTEALLNLLEDLEEQKKLAADKEQKFRAIFEGASDGILVADSNAKKFVLANQRICEITGYSKEELLKLDVTKIHPKKDLPYVLVQLKKQLQGKITLTENIPVLRKDGKVVYCDVNSKPIMIGKQKVLLGLFRDVTKRNETEERLRKNETRFRSFIENSSELMQSVDRTGRFVYVNKAWRQALGYSFEEAKKLHFMKILRKDQIGHCSTIFKKLLKGETFSDVETVFISKKGKEIPVSGNISSHFEGGKFVSTIGLFRKVRQKKSK